jgi:glucuronate isomerase
MTPFPGKDFLLHNDIAKALYQDHAERQPIIDYHGHLSPQLIAEDHVFPNITKAWLEGDHYKWRAMRTNGVGEEFCAGKADDRDKFRQWAATVPRTLRNPLYHWTHLELQRYFGITELLGPDTADNIYDRCTEQLQQPGYSVRGLLKKMNVQVVCTTDDPIDDLRHHISIREKSFGIRVLPAFRPDKSMSFEDVHIQNKYYDELEQSCDVEVNTIEGLLEALRSRHDYFAEQGCTVADHGLEQMPEEELGLGDLRKAFTRLRNGDDISQASKGGLRNFILQQVAEWNAEKGWVQQYHLGAMRNNNQRKRNSLGADTGWDSIGDFPQARALSRFLDRLDGKGKLAKTILYNLNPADNAVFATMAGNFNDGTLPGKVQYGAAWWFQDQHQGITEQINALSSMGLLSRFVGMLTDSRSFLSFPRHEYFRRILCNLLGEEIGKGILPDDRQLVGSLIEGVCHRNAKEYFNW